MADSDSPLIAQTVRADKDTAPPASEKTSPAGKLGGFTSPDELPRGSSIGRYLVVKKLGAGGMGVVYAAYDPELSRKVAIKLLRKDTGGHDDSQGRVRLQREAQAMARLSHPNVTAVYDVGTAFEQVFVAMEFVEGGTLTDWLAAGNRSVDEILEKFYYAGRGLAAAHAAGLIHRDFKPDNVLVGLDGRPSVTDFGLARDTSSAEAPAADAKSAIGVPVGSSTSTRLAGLPPEIQQAIANSQPLSAPLTQAGALMGTPRFMAPEQWNGKPTDARTDLYSFCSALYEALYRIPPFPGTSVGDLCLNTLEGKVQQPVDRLGVPSFMHRALLRGLSVQPADRFQTMDELLAVLSPEQRRSRRQLLLGTGLLLGLLVLCGSIWGLFRVQMARKVSACNNVRAQLDRAWGADAKTQAQNGMMATKANYAADVWSRVDANVEKYLLEWRTMLAASCHATIVTRRQPRAVHNRRLLCLQAKLQEVAAFADLLRSADEEVLDKATDTSSDFSPLSSCADVSSLGQEIPDSPDMLERVNKLYLEMATIKVMARLGRYAPARERSYEVVKAAQQVNYGPATARAFWQLGNIQSNAADFSAAERSFFGSVVAGVRGGDHRETAMAYMELMRLTGNRFQQFEQADRYQQLALAELNHVHDDPRQTQQMEINIDWYGCLVDSARREYVRAEERCQRALTSYEKLYGSERPPSWIVLSLANLYKRQGRFEESLKLYREALDVLRKTAGPEHPRTGSAMFNIAGLLAIEGQYAEAFDYFRRALAIYKKSFGEHSVKLFDTYTQMARFSYKSNKLDDALLYARQANDSVKHSPEVSKVADGRSIIGEVLYRQGRYAEALVEHQAVLDLCDQRRCDQSMPGHLTAVADDLRELRKGKQALPLLEQAMRLLPANADREMQARVQFSMAQTLVAAGGKKDVLERAHELAESARKTYKALGRGSKHELAEVEGWLDKN